MTVQSLTENTKTRQPPTQIIPWQQVIVHSGAVVTSRCKQDLLSDLNSVGLDGFRYFPHCPHVEQLVAPQSYQMFILAKQNSLSNVIMINDTFIQEADSSYLKSTLNTPQRLTETDDISNRLTMFYQEAKSDFPGRSLLMKDLAQIITRLLLHGSRTAINPPLKRRPKDIGPALELIRNNYSKQLSLTDIANQANYSKYYFTRIFKEEIGKSPFEYLTAIRLEKAKQLLRSTNRAITEICFQCGFQNSCHFANVFKLHTGKSPREFRQDSTRDREE